jgi:hypothetical protein
LGIYRKKSRVIQTHKITQKPSTPGNVAFWLIFVEKGIVYIQYNFSQAQWKMLIQLLGNQKQEKCEFEASLSYIINIASPVFKTEK